MLILFVVSFSGFFLPADGCVATGGGSPSTPGTPGTTEDCTACVVGDITFTVGDTVLETPTNEDPVAGAAGCLSMIVHCPATNNGPIFMQFNGVQGGPSDVTGAEVSATLNCVDGQWIFAPVGEEERPITEVNCINT